MKLPRIVFQEMPNKENDDESYTGEVKTRYSEDGVKIDKSFVGADGDDCTRLRVGAVVPGADRVERDEWGQEEEYLQRLF